MDHREDFFHLGVKALIHNSKGKLLLLQKNTKKSQVLKSPLWDLPGGRIQKGESLEEALKREVYEETGLQNMTQMTPFTMVVSNIRIFLSDRDVGLIYKVYLCDIVGDSPIQLSHEHTGFEWLEPIKVAALLSVDHPAELTERLAILQLPMHHL